MFRIEVDGKSTPNTKAKSPSTPTPPEKRQRSNSKNNAQLQDVTVSLAVEIPAEWESQITDRILMVRRAMEKTTENA